MSALSKFTIQFVHFRLRFNMVNAIEIENIPGNLNVY